MTRGCPHVASPQASLGHRVGRLAQAHEVIRAHPQRHGEGAQVLGAGLGDVVLNGVEGIEGQPDPRGQLLLGEAAAEAELLTRFEALLKRGDIRPIPPKPTRSGGWKRQSQGYQGDRR